MYVNIHGNVYEFEPENTTVFYGETMINGIYFDFPEEDTYLFVPEEVLENYDEVASEVICEGAAEIELNRYDPQAEPYLFIINAMCRLFAREVEVCVDHDEDDAPPAA